MEWIRMPDTKVRKAVQKPREGQESESDHPKMTEDTRCQVRWNLEPLLEPTLEKDSNAVYGKKQALLPNKPLEIGLCSASHMIRYSCINPDTKNTEIVAKVLAAVVPITGLQRVLTGRKGMANQIFLNIWCHLRPQSSPKDEAMIGMSISGLHSSIRI